MTYLMGVKNTIELKEMSFKAHCRPNTTAITADK